MTVKSDHVTQGEAFWRRIAILALVVCGLLAGGQLVRRLAICHGAASRCGA